MDATRRTGRPWTVAPRRLNTEAFKRLATDRGAETVDEIADLFGVHRATISRWMTEEGQEQAQASALRIADTLGVEVDHLFPPRTGEAA